MTTLNFFTTNGLCLIAQYTKNPYYKNTIEFGGHRIVLQELPFDIRNTKVQIFIYEGIRNIIKIKHDDKTYSGWFDTSKNACYELYVRPL